jgi:hypothetical protein
MKQSSLDEIIEPSPLLEATGELHVGVLPQKRPLLNPLLHPVPDLRVPKLLKGANVPLISVLNVVEGVERIHSESGCVSIEM